MTGLRPLLSRGEGRPGTLTWRDAHKVLHARSGHARMVALPLLGPAEGLGVDDDPGRGQTCEELLTALTMCGDGRLRRRLHAVLTAHDAKQPLGHVGQRVGREPPCPRRPRSCRVPTSVHTGQLDVDARPIPARRGTHRPCAIDPSCAIVRSRGLRRPWTLRRPRGLRRPCGLRRRRGFRRPCRLRRLCGLLGP